MFQVLHNSDDASALLASSAGGGAIVGYFPDLFSTLGERGTDGRLGINYRRFLHASYLLLETDPFRREVGPVAAVTSPKLAFQLQLNQVTQPIQYYTVYIQVQ